MNIYCFHFHCPIKFCKITSDPLWKSRWRSSSGKQWRGGKALVCGFCLPTCPIIAGVTRGPSQSPTLDFSSFLTCQTSPHHQTFTFTLSSAHNTLSSTLYVAKTCSSFKSQMTCQHFRKVFSECSLLPTCPPIV